MESWRRFIEESENSTKSFAFSAEEIDALNRANKKITNASQRMFGAEWEEAPPAKFVDEDNLETVEPSVTEDNDEETEKLRQQYYGPGRELEKRGPRRSKGAEKGFGAMSAQDFEATDFVMKVPKEVLEDFRVMVEESKKTGELYTQARNWYHNIRKLLDQETDNDRDSALLGLLIATYSPRAKFALNLTEAVFMFKAVEKDVKTNPELLQKYLETFPGAEKREPGEPRGFTSAHKVPNFALNLIAPELSGQRDSNTGEMTYNDVYNWNSTIDTWMIDAFYPNLKRASTAKEWEGIKGKLMSHVAPYRYMSQLVSQEAKRLGLLPHELQAIVWVSMQVRQTGDADLGVTTEFATNQIKEAIRNIQQINGDLEEAASNVQESESWLKTIFSEIDNKGFAEAAKIVLGDKEAGAKGVRSITSMGKKGSAFKYYELPPEDKPEKKPKDKKPKKKKEPVAKPYKDSYFSELNTFYVMNSVIQMPTGKFNNLYDSIMLYLDPEFSTEKAVEYITGRFDPEATAEKDYFKEDIE